MKTIVPKITGMLHSDPLAAAETAVKIKEAENHVTGRMQTALQKALAIARIKFPVKNADDLVSACDKLTITNPFTAPLEKASIALDAAGASVFSSAVEASGSNLLEGVQAVMNTTASVFQRTGKSEEEKLKEQILELHRIIDDYEENILRIKTDVHASLTKDTSSSENKYHNKYGHNWNNSYNDIFVTLPEGEPRIRTRAYPGFKQPANSTLKNKNLTNKNYGRYKGQFLRQRKYWSKNDSDYVRNITRKFNAVKAVKTAKNNSKKNTTTPNNPWVGRLRGRLRGVTDMLTGKKKQGPSKIDH